VDREVHRGFAWASTLAGLPDLAMLPIALARATFRSPTIVQLNGATRTLPLGFKSAEQFARASEDLQGALRLSGIDDAVVGVRGSSITGASFKTGAPFGPQSDIDFFVESAKLTEGYRVSPNIPGFVHPKPILRDNPLLRDWSLRWQNELGRKVTPGAFVPGSIPDHPAILVRP